MHSASAIALVGNPNVGKSVLFHRLTGAYVNVSNYPGTTVEVARAAARFDAQVDLIDTPGVLTLPARSDGTSTSALKSSSSRASFLKADAIAVGISAVIYMVQASRRLVFGVCSELHSEIHSKGGLL